MAKFDFEEYRQPWETGPHWELKREFMENYQNDYTLDRLLCLAQAYSNIELLHCSYPEPVMREVSQLSFQLKGCKRFRDADADLEKKRKEKSELQPRKAGKACSYDEISSKPYKFIKFCSAKAVSDQSKATCEPDEKSNDTSGFNLFHPKSSTDDSKTSLDGEDLKKPCIAVVANNNDALPSNNDCTIFSLSCSPDFSLMETIAAAIPKKYKTPLEGIESAIEECGLENAVKYVFVREKASVICCQFRVGNTLVATGRGSSEKSAKELAVQYGVEILTNLSKLPHKTLDDVKKQLENWKQTTNSTLLWSKITSSDLKSKTLISQLSQMEKNPMYADLHLILSFVEKLDEQGLNTKTPAVQKIQGAAFKLKCSQVNFFHFTEDPDTLLHLRNFHCDFIIKNIFICQSKAFSKKKAKVDASELGLRLLTNFIENCELEKQNVEVQVQSLGVTCMSSKDIVTDISSDIKVNKSDPNGISFPASSENIFTNQKPQLKEPQEETYFQTPFSNNLFQTHGNTPEPRNEYNNQGNNGSRNKRKLFKINHKLLNNSRYQQLVVFDLSETSCKNVASSILHVTASRCKKNIDYNIEEIAANDPRHPPNFRCSVALNEEIIGIGYAFTKQEAKSIAADNALKHLQNNFYTLKVKDEIGESFVISRSHVLTAENPSSVLSESNVGCKMLKMMGWSGGGIGKTSGITEPIIASDQRFGQGLGFSNTKALERRFKQKIEALIKDYSQSNTTSDLIFSTEFSKDERKEIHKLAMRYNLLNVSRGKGQQRQLFIGRKLSAMELLEHLIEAGGSTPKYELEDRSSSVSQ